MAEDATAPGQAESPASATVSTPTAGGRIPGEAGIWVVIAGDLILFSCLFVIFLHTRAAQLDVFEQGRVQLNSLLGLVNTLLLLTSSWFVASAVHAMRKGWVETARQCYAYAIACGLGFVGVKVIEYGEKLAANITLTTNDFFMLYFIYTGIHLLHVLIGLGVLLASRMYCRRAARTPNGLSHLETGASFWHLVDLLWIVLFALLYLAGTS